LTKPKPIKHLPYAGQKTSSPSFDPANSPQLNPQERFWQHLKAQLEGEHFTSLSQLRQRLKQILAALLPTQVASLTSYDFILKALFYAAL
jgi:hypothetical protein